MENTDLSALLSIEGGERKHVADIKRVTWVGMFVNIFLSGFKITAGTMGSSQAVVADGVHSLSDTVTDVALLVGVKYWLAPPDREHPHGHRRIETVITAMIGIILAIVAAGIGYNAISTLGKVHKGPPGMVALIAALASIVSKEALYQWNVRVGRRIKSSAMIANAWHHRSDGLSSVPAAIAVAGARFFPEYYFLDHIGAVLVCIFIIQAAWSITWPALKELVDTGASEDICREIEHISLDTEGVVSVHKCRTRKLGFGLQVDLHVQVKPDLTVRTGHDIAEDVKRKLIKEGPGVVDVITHLEPYENDEEK